MTFRPYEAGIYTDGSKTANEFVDVALTVAAKYNEFADILGRVRSVESTDKLPTAGVDKTFRIYVNPAYWAKCDNNTRKGLVIHELLHPVLACFVRHEAAGVADFQRWNIANDMMINGIVRGYGVCIPATWCLPPKEYAGIMTTEHLYPHTKSGDGDGSAGRGCGVSELPGGGQQGAAPERAPIGQPEASEWIFAARRHNKEVAKLEARPLCVPKWAKYLRQCYSDLQAQKRGGAHTSYRRPRERQGLLLPSHVSSVPTVALVIDVSGSITEQARTEMVKLAMSLAQEYSDIRTLVVSHTDRVEFTGWAKAGTMQAMAEQACQYSGGTRVEPAYAKVKELTRKLVDLLVHFTDCYIERPWPVPPAKSLLVLDWGTGHGVALPNGAKKVQVVIS